MKDYKGRGSNLSFGEPKKSRRGWMLIPLIAVAAAAIYLALQWWQDRGEIPAEKAPLRGDSGNAIPLQLPPAPTSLPEETTEQENR
jgi:hypothetical protein